MCTLSKYERCGEYLLLLRCNLKNVIKNNGLLWHLNECLANFGWNANWVYTNPSTVCRRRGWVDIVIHVLRAQWLVYLSMFFVRAQSTAMISHRYNSWAALNSQKIKKLKSLDIIPISITTLENDGCWQLNKNKLYFLFYSSTL